MTPSQRHRFRDVFIASLIPFLTGTTPLDVFFIHLYKQSMSKTGKPGVFQLSLIQLNFSGPSATDRRRPMQTATGPPHWPAPPAGAGQNRRPRQRPAAPPDSAAAPARASTAPGDTAGAGAPPPAGLSAHG